MKGQRERGVRLRGWRVVCHICRVSVEKQPECYRCYCEAIAASSPPSLALPAAFLALIMQPLWMDLVPSVPAGKRFNFCSPERGNLSLSHSIFSFLIFSESHPRLVSNVCLLLFWSFAATLTLLAPWQLQCEAASGHVDAAPS